MCSSMNDVCEVSETLEHVKSHINIPPWLLTKKKSQSVTCDICVGNKMIKKKEINERECTINTYVQKTLQIV